MLNYIIVGIASFCAGATVYGILNCIPIKTFRKLIGYEFEHNELEKKLMRENECLVKNICMYEDFNADLIKKNTYMQNKMNKIREMTYSSYKDK